ncbi:MAG: hypothetical protein IJT98_02305 [Prevotella sp.]|nr:hypothetical protein [Prevotella sp.]
MNRKIVITALLALVVLTGCKTNGLTEAQRFERSVLKELPFAVDSIRWLTGVDVPTFWFLNGEYTSYAPDAEIRPDGSWEVWKKFVPEKLTRQWEENIWRNVVVSRKNRRVICIDRYLRHGRTEGYCYIYQSEHRKYPTYGTFHWDVSDPHNVEFTGMMLEDMRKLAMKRQRLADGELEVPTSQEAYWHLMFHADSLFDARLYDEARRVYDLAFTEDRYILPSQLSTIAKKMSTIGATSTALAYLRHRIAIEKDFYEDPSMCSYEELKDTFLQRCGHYHYDIALKEQLEYIFERDQYDRLLWSQATKDYPSDTQRNEQLARRALSTDSLNLALVGNILQRHGFPRRERVGDFANQTVWLVFQHADLEYQKWFLPQMESAVARGDIAPVFLAMLRDRIDVREGRPQKYGTQMDSNGQLAPLLDASRVNEWRQEVGLPPME